MSIVIDGAVRFAFDFGQSFCDYFAGGEPKGPIANSVVRILERYMSYTAVPVYWQVSGVPLTRAFKFQYMTF